MMKKIYFLVFIVICLVKYSFSQTQYQTFKVSNDIEVIKITEHSYVHVSYTHMPEWGRIPSNGLIFANNGKAALFDSPMTDSLTKDLINWIRDSLKVEIILFVPNHWHNDCMGGLAYLNSLGIESYANEMTIQIAISKNLPVPSHSFKDSLILDIDGKKIICNYLGAAHTIDNIIIWIPSEKILFAGCMVKEINSTGLGNVADGGLIAYPATIERVLDKYRDAEFVIPGHGKFGGIELLKHTYNLSKNN